MGTQWLIHRDEVNSFHVGVGKWRGGRGLFCEQVQVSWVSGINEVVAISSNNGSIGKNTCTASSREVPVHTNARGCG